MDVLKLLGDQQATNRANFAQAQVDRAEGAATKAKQWSAQGRDANSGSMALSADGEEPKLLGNSITSGLIKPGQSVRVNGDGRTVMVDQKPASKQAIAPPDNPATVKGNVKLLFRIDTPEGVELWVCGWQTDAVLAFTVPKGGNLGFASIDNLGGDGWGLNVCWGMGSDLKVQYISSDASLDSSHDVPSDLRGFGCTGFGFWAGFYGDGGEGSYRIEYPAPGTRPPYQIAEYFVFPSQFRYYLFNGVEKQLYVPAARYVKTQYVESYDYSYFTQPKHWVFQEIAIPGDPEFEEPFFITHEEIYDDLAPRSNFEISGVGLIYYLQRINPDGSQGFGLRYTKPYDGEPEWFWVSNASGLLTIPAADLPVAGFIDVFEDYFTFVDAKDDPNYYAYTYAYAWDADATIKLVAYDSLFTLQEQFEVQIYKADLQYSNNHPPTFLSASYHP